MNAHPRREQGQILVLFVLGLVGLLGFAALAIDGSMIYSDRRYDQSVADAAALAGAANATTYMNTNGIRTSNFNCPNSGLQLAAINGANQRVQSNNMPALASDLSTGHGVVVECVSAGSLKYLKITVQVSSETKTSFAHLVLNRDNIRNTVTTEVEVRPPGNAAAGFAVISVGTDCTVSKTGNAEDGISFMGTVDATITNAGLFSNSCMGGNGNVNVSSISGVNPAINYSYVEERLTGGAVVSPEPGPPPAGRLQIELPPPDCSGLTARSVTSTNLQPGIYTSISAPSGSVMAPGLYCVTSGGFQANGDLTGNGVTIYIQNGGFDAGNNKHYQVQLFAPSTSANGAVQGLVLYMDKNNHSDVDMRGGAQTTYSGTIYAPGSTIEMGGCSGTSSSDGTITYSAQFIGDYVKMHGGPALNLWYDESLLMTAPSTLSLTK